MNKVPRQCILTTCGDANCTQGHKHVDPALFLYVGCLVIFTGDNKHLEDVVSRGNGTQCEVVKVKLDSTTDVVIKNYCGRKVRTVLADQVECLELKMIDKLEGMATIEHDIEEIQQKLMFDNSKILDKNKN